jgi:hypothetical protein
MKKDFIVSKIEAPQDGSRYVLVDFTDPNAVNSTGRGGSGDVVPFTSPEDLMKNLPLVNKIERYHVIHIVGYL